MVINFSESNSALAFLNEYLQAWRHKKWKHLQPEGDVIKRDYVDGSRTHILRGRITSKEKRRADERLLSDTIDRNRGVFMTWSDGK